jgi:flagellar biosynthesis/type III secretory pathway protein FliH
MKNKAGRKPGCTPEVIKKISDGIKLGMTKKLAAQYGGIAEGTYWRWMKAKGPRYDELREAVKEAESAGAAALLAKVHKAANDGTWTAAAWMLERVYGYRKDRAPEVAPAVTKVKKVEEDREAYLVRKLEEAEEAVATATKDGSWQAAINGQRLAIQIRDQLDAVRNAPSEVDPFDSDQLVEMVLNLPGNVLTHPKLLEKIQNG